MCLIMAVIAGFEHGPDDVARDDVVCGSIHGGHIATARAGRQARALDRIPSVKPNARL